MKFGLCYLVFLNDSSSFKGAFISMCQTLNLNYNVLAKRNQKDLTVEYFRKFLKKSVIIAAEDRGTNDVLDRIDVITGYRSDEIVHRSIVLI